MTTDATKVDSIADFASTPDGQASRWKAELDLASKEFDKFWARCDEIDKRYKAESEVEGAVKDRMCLLWAQVETELPAIYQRRPQPQVSRRFKAKDATARVASMIAERYLAVDIERDGIDSEAKALARAFLLHGRAVAWIDNAPQFASKEDKEVAVDLRAPLVALPQRDFLHSASRNWREVTWVARRHQFTRDAAVKQFGEGMKRFKWEAKDLPLDTEPTQTNESKEAAGDVFKRATIWEIWDAASGMVIYIHRSMLVPIDIREQPVKLESRFPVPEPCYGTLTDGSLIPTPAFMQWQATQEEIDELSTRIRALTKTIKIIGTYDASHAELANLLDEGGENVLKAVKDWRTMQDKGGLGAAVNILPIEERAQALVILGEQRQQRIDMLNQLSGHTDVMRGQSDPRTTAAAERIKSNYGSLRLQEKQADFQRFMERVLRVKSEVIVELAPAPVMLMVSSAEEIPEVEQHRAAVQQARQQHQQAVMQAMQTGQPPPPAPPPQPDILEGAIELLKSEKLRDFRLEVQERSMAAIDEAEEKAEATEFTKAIGELLKAAAGAPPALLDYIGETALFLARRHRCGREMESTIENTLQALKHAAEQARNAKPQKPPQVQAEELRAQNAQQELAQKHAQEMEKIRADADREDRRETAQAQSQRMIEAFKAESKMQIAQFEAQIDMTIKAMEARIDMQAKEREMRLEERLAVNQAQMDERAHRMKAETDRFSAAQDAHYKAQEARDKRNSGPKRKRVKVDGETFDFDIEDVPTGTMQ